jgi:hypothetical protein
MARYRNLDQKFSPCAPQISAPEMIESYEAVSAGAGIDE